MGSEAAGAAGAGTQTARLQEVSVKAERALPMLVYCDAGLTILSIIVNRVMSGFLPATLMAFLEKEGAAPRETGDFVLMGLCVAVSAATLLAWIGLLRLWRPARVIYFWTWVAAGLLLLFESIL